MTKQEFIELLKQIENGTFISTELRIGVSEFDEERQEERLNDEQIILLAEAIKKNSNITKLDLSGNDFGDKGAIALASVSTLKELNIYDTRVGPVGVKALAGSTLQKLSEFCLSFDEKAYTQFLEMIDALINNKTIIELNLGCSYIPNEMIAQLIGKNTTIIILVLGRHLTDEAFEFIQSNTTLEILQLTDSQITDKGVEYIVKNTSLKELNIARSEITGIGAKLLSTYPSLKELYIRDSDITFEEAKVFINSNLDKFHLDTNLKHDITSWKECDYINHLFYETQKLKSAQLIENPQQSKKNKFEEYSEDEQDDVHLGKKIRAEYIDTNDSPVLTDLIGNLEFFEETA